MVPKAVRPLLPSVVRALLLGGLVALVVVGRGEASEVPEGRFEGALEVRLVEVELVVTDRAGVAVDDLRREELELRVDGEVAEIEHLAAHGPAGAAAGLEAELVDAPSPRLAAEPVQLVVYVDRAFVEPGGLAGVPEALTLFLTESLPAKSQVALVTSDAGLERISGFVEPGLAAARLASLPSGFGRGRALASEYAEISRAIRRGARSPTDSLNQDPDGASRSLMARISALSTHAQAQVEVTSAQLERLCDAMAGLPGRRVLLYLGGPPPVGAGEALVASWQASFGRHSSREAGRLAFGDAGAQDVSSPTVPADLFGSADRQLEAAASYAAARGVVFHVLDLGAGGAVAGGALALGSSEAGDERGGGSASLSRQEGSRRLRERQALESLAAGTGGRYLAHGQKLAAGLRDLGAELASYYTVAFTPPAVAGGPEGELGVAGRLEVRVKRRGRWVVRHRTAYRLRSADRAAAEATLAALLLGAREAAGSADPLGLARYVGVANPLEVEITAEPTRTDDAGATWLPLTLRVPFERLALAPAGRAHSGRLSIFAAAGDWTVGVQPVRQAQVPVRLLNEELVASGGRQVEYRFELPLVGPAPRVAVTVRDDLAAIFSTVILELEAAPAQVARAPVFVSAPLIRSR